MNTNDIWLIAGLGNPEAKYDGTRHNAGFAALDYLSGKWGISVSKTKFQGLWGQGEVDGHKVVLLKPLTYMNLSGDSIAPLAGFFKIPADHVIVLCDDITQNPGKLRIRPSGSAQRPKEHHRPAGRRRLSPHPHRHRCKAPPGLRPGGLGAGQISGRGRQGHHRSLRRP